MTVAFFELTLLILTNQDPAPGLDLRILYQKENKKVDYHGADTLQGVLETYLFVMMSPSTI